MSKSRFKSKFKKINIFHICILFCFFEIISGKNLSLKYGNDNNKVSSLETTSIALICCCILFSLLSCFCRKER